MAFGEDGDLKTIENANIKKVLNFLYLGAWIGSSSSDIKVRKAKAWSALNKMHVIWKSSMNRNLKIRLFRATVESVLLYGAETWTLNRKLTKKLDGCYTRMLRVVQSISWKDFVNNNTLYGDLPKVTDTLRVKRLRLAGHIWRGNEVVKELLFWEPTQGSRSRGRPAITYVNQLLSDTVLSKRDRQRAMENREMWKRVMK